MVAVARARVCVEPLEEGPRAGRRVSDAVRGPSGPPFGSKLRREAQMRNVYYEVQTVAAFEVSRMIPAGFSFQANQLPTAEYTQ